MGVHSKFKLYSPFPENDQTKENSFHDGVLAADGNIYGANNFGQILKIDTINNKCTIFGDRMNWNDKYHRGWNHLCLVQINAFIFLLLAIAESSNSIQEHRIYRLLVNRIHADTETNG